MTDLAELMSRDPRRYTQQDRDAIIAYYRERRHQFKAGNKLAGKTKVTEKQKETLSLAKQLDLEIKL